MSANSRPYSTGSFMLELEQNKTSTPAGYILSIDGGHFKSEPVKYLEGTSMRPTLYPGRPKFDDITITVGATVAPAFFDWIKASIDGKHERRNGAIVGYDFNGKEVSRRQFTNAILSELQLPALDAAGKTSATITVKIAPETLEFIKGDGSAFKPAYAQNEIGKQQRWLVSNFRFTIDRFKSANTRYTKIDAFTIKQNIINNPVGRELQPFREFGRIEVPNLVLTFAETHVHEWWEWYQKTVINGDHGDATTASITYLALNLADELMSVKFDGVQLLSIEHEKYEANKDQIAKVKCTLTVEAVSIEKGGGSKGKNG